MPDMHTLLEVLRCGTFRAAVNGLPGYRADEAGTVVTFDQAFAAEPAGERKRGRS